MAYNVKCIVVDEGSDFDDCYCIDQIGVQEKGETNQYSPAKIYDRIKEEGDMFFVEHEGERRTLKTAKRNGTKYVKTERNDTPEDNLLQQPKCS